MESSAKILQNCSKVKIKLFSLVEMAARLRGERKARGLNQADFGALGGVGLQTQSRYEKAETEPSASYLGALGISGIDVQYILTGCRAGESLDPDIALVVDVLKRVAAPTRHSIVYLVQTIASTPAFSPGEYRYFQGEGIVPSSFYNSEEGVRLSSDTKPAVQGREKKEP
ncbi:MAG: helix-turn-helix transcriptional regulator [Pseudomonadota bacterium]|nr:helix-turn-helix transcriptional regulator [Pseudomonadota bacterium]